MKIYKNQTRQNAKALGFMANFAFAEDKNISPFGIDITSVKKQGDIYPHEYEVTEFNAIDQTATIKIMNPKEFKKFIEENEQIYPNKAFAKTIH